MLVRLAALSLAACAGVLAAPRPAAADTERFRGLYLEGWYGKVGLESGVVFARERGAAPTLGGAATLVHMNDHLEWYGLQGDLLVDWNGDRPAGARWSLGPEFGVSLYGVDLSYFGEQADREIHHGFQARAKLTVGLAAVYLRGAYTLAGASGEDESSLEAGLQLKLPVYMARHRRSLRSAGIASR
jgi:hypothetical protein